MKDDIGEVLEKFFGILIGVLGVMAILSIFEDDSSKIVSKKGRKFLSDDEKMKDINQQIQEAESHNQYNEVFVN